MKKFHPTVQASDVPYPDNHCFGTFKQPNPHIPFGKLQQRCSRRSRGVTGKMGKSPPREAPLTSRGPTTVWRSKECAIEQRTSSRSLRGGRMAF